MRTKSIEWAAGLFEGEGCITTKRRKSNGKQSARLKLVSTDKDVVRAFADAVEGGYIREVQPKGNRKLIYHWDCQNIKGVRRILKNLYPHLGTRRKARANEILPLLQTSTDKE